MSRVDELIAELCPDGVEFKALDEIATTVAGLSGKSKPDFTDGNARYVTYKNAFANLEVDQSSSDFVRIEEGEKQNRLRVGDVVITGSSESLGEVGMSSVVASEPAEPLFLNSFCFVVRFTDPSRLVPGFSKYLFRSDDVRKQIRGTASGVTRINVSKVRFLKIRIPVPPLEVQREIVRILDQFTALEAELEAELEARRRQYDFYRDRLFTETRAPRQPLGNVGQFERGRRFTKKDVVPSGIPSIHYGEIYTRYGIAAHEAHSHVRVDLLDQLRFAQPHDVVIAGVGETVEDVGKAVAWMGSDSVAIHDDTFLYRSELNPKYVSYFFQTDDFHLQKERHVARAKIKRLSREGLAQIAIPTPPRAEQERIVETLDGFDALVNDLTIGLPAELAARRKQYEYYRDRLLTFKERVA